jgi:hypothetical protein
VVLAIDVNSLLHDVLDDHARRRRAPLYEPVCAVPKESSERKRQQANAQKGAADDSEKAHLTTSKKPNCREQTPWARGHEAAILYFAVKPLATASVNFRRRLY